MSTTKGRRGEDAACAWLVQHGHRILARNVRLARGELDIVARDNESLLFIEVKAHRSRDSALLAVTADKCRRLRQAAELWLARHPQYASLQCRFDLIMLTPARERTGRFHIEHIKDIIR
ncbi:MAG: YraN family protein [Zetaproteobacteria bacterium]|nr:MAG: YraN family protein [Zetaproteobacteria bacterium]